MRRLAAAALLCLGVCASAAAQTLPADRPGPYVIDVRGTTVSLPNDPAFYPPVPASTTVPSRAYGIDAGAHVYLMQFGAARLGIGATYLRARGTASAAAPAPTSGASGSGAVPATTPAVAALATTIAPQISVNFGSRAGWSYLSAGIGRATITTRTSAFGTTPVRLLDSGTRSSVNVGGGARWFAKPRLAFSFDVRFHIVGAGGEVDAATPRTTLLAVSVGVSLR
jgi:hypothetical protein